MYNVRILTTNKGLIEVTNVFNILLSGNHLIVTQKDVEITGDNDEKFFLSTENKVYPLESITSYTTIRETKKYNIQ
jgi:hypothetical protein